MFIRKSLNGHSGHKIWTQDTKQEINQDVHRARKINDFEIWTQDTEVEVILCSTAAARCGIDSTGKCSQSASRSREAVPRPNHAKKPVRSARDSRHLPASHSSVPSLRSLLLNTVAHRMPSSTITILHHLIPACSERRSESG